jgi:hypothetical protein
MPTPIIPRDLGKQAPHSPRHRLDGFVIASRTVDKCRAKAAGTLGEYQYAGPLDQLLFHFKGITSDQFDAAAQGAKNYEDVGAWLHLNGTPKSEEQIKTWSDSVEASNPMKNAESRSRFIENCHKLGLNPEMNSTFDWLEADDRETFRRQAG